MLDQLQVSLKLAIYSIKLKLKFAVLGQLICLVGGSSVDRSRKSSTSVPFVKDKSDRSQTQPNDWSDVVDATNFTRPNGGTCCCE